MISTLRAILCLLPFVFLSPACRQQQLSSSDLSLEVSVSDPSVGLSRISVSIRDKNGNLVDAPGAVTLRGDMDHAGMAPVFAESAEAVNGVFTLPFEWSMAGAWILEATLNLDAGGKVVESFRYEILSPAGDQDMSLMDHNGGDHREAEDGGHSYGGGESSAIYLRIDNKRASAVTITSAASPAARRVEFHRTVVESDVARMEPLEALFIPAGETIELRPGGSHIMLRQLMTDLKLGSSIDLRLETALGETIQLSVPIMNMLMDGDMRPTTVGDLVFSKLWARPANKGAMGNIATHRPESVHAE